MTHKQCAKSNGACLATIANIITKYIIGGVSAVTEFKRNVNSSNARRKEDRHTEARLIELACALAPERHSRWTVRPLEEESKVILGIPVSHPIVCMDENPYQLLSEAREPLPMIPGNDRKTDSSQTSLTV